MVRNAAFDMVIRLHTARSGLRFKAGLPIEGSRRPFTLAVALKKSKGQLFTG
jgi:hypothetical protein